MTAAAYKHGCELLSLQEKQGVWPDAVCSEQLLQDSPLITIASDSMIEVVMGSRCHPAIRGHGVPEPAKQIVTATTHHNWRLAVLHYLKLADSDTVQYVSVWISAAALIDSPLSCSVSECPAHEVALC